VKNRLGLEWVLGTQVLAALDDLDCEPVDEIRGVIECEHDEGPH
jgi:hypothetical protein